MRMQPDFEKANEIYFRLGIIYKQQNKYTQSLEVSGPFSDFCVCSRTSADLLSLQCFKYIVNDPPRPLTEEDIWFQIGHVHEQQKDVGPPAAPFQFDSPVSLTVLHSTIPRNLHTDVSWIAIRATQRFYSSSDGCITSRATATPARNRLSIISRSRSAQVSL